MRCASAQCPCSACSAECDERRLLADVARQLAAHPEVRYAHWSEDVKGLWAQLEPVRTHGRGLPVARRPAVEG